MASPTLTQEPGSTAGSAVRVVTPAPRDVWDELVATDPESMPGQTAAWLDCLCAGRSHTDASRLYEWPDGQQLVLPMARRSGLPGVAGVEASLPTVWGIGGVLARREPQAAHVRAVAEDLASRSLLRTRVRPNPRRGALWATAAPDGAVVIPRRAHVLDLSGGFDTVWSDRFKARTRSKARKAERAGVTVECDTTGALMPDFHRLYMLSVDRWGARQREPLALARWRAARREPLGRLQHIGRTMGAGCQLWLARLDGEPIAGIMVLRGANSAHYTRGAMDLDRAGPVEANYLLFRRAIEDACADGVQRLHMGESGTSSSLSFFKERFGAEAYDYAEYRFERLPLTRVDRLARDAVKRLIGFEDAD